MIYASATSQLSGAVQNLTCSSVESYHLIVVVVQIPSDLISFDPANSALGAEASVGEKLKAVKGHVKQIEGMVRLQLRGRSAALQHNIFGVYAFVFACLRLL